jgi:transposase
MGIYSQDLRERVIAAVKRGTHSQAEVAEQFSVRLLFVEKLLRRERTTGSCAVSPRAGGRPRALRNDEGLIRAAVAKRADSTLAGLCEQVVKDGGTKASPSMMCRELKRLRLPKKKSFHASEQETERVKPLRQTYRERVVNWLGGKLKFLDEAGVQFGMSRRYGRAAPGIPVPTNFGSNWTMVASIGATGLEAPWLIGGAMDGPAFEVYVQDCLCPTLHPGDIVIMDNLSSHRQAKIRTLIEACEAHLEFLPPYSPDMNPIELCWSKVKTSLPSAKAGSFDTLLEAVRQAFLSIKASDSLAWFHHCGYAVD